MSTAPHHTEGYHINFALTAAAVWLLLHGYILSGLYRPKEDLLVVHEKSLELMHEGHAAVGEQYLMLEDKELSEMCQRTILNHVEYMTDPILENVSVSTTSDMVFNA